MGELISVLLIAELFQSHQPSVTLFVLSVYLLVCFFIQSLFAYCWDHLRSVKEATRQKKKERQENKRKGENSYFVACILQANKGAHTVPTTCNKRVTTILDKLIPTLLQEVRSQIPPHKPLQSHQFYITSQPDIKQHLQHPAEYAQQKLTFPVTLTVRPSVSKTSELGRRSADPPDSALPAPRSTSLSSIVPAALRGSLSE